MKKLLNAPLLEIASLIMLMTLWSGTAYGQDSLKVSLNDARAILTYSNSCDAVADKLESKIREVEEVKEYVYELQDIVVGYERRVDTMLVASDKFRIESDKAVKELQKQVNSNKSRKNLWKWTTFIGVPTAFVSGHYIK